MTVSTLRPNATTTFTGATTGAASAHAALSDNSDASYITLDGGETWQGGLTDLTLPANAAIKTVTLRHRTARVATSAVLAYGSYKTLTPATALYVGPNSLITWSVPTTITTGSKSQAGWTDADVDGAFGVLTNLMGAGLDPLRIYEAYVDITYVVKPTLTVDAPISPVVDTNLPIVTWTPTLDSDGGGQARYWVKVFSDAQYLAGGFDPNTSTPVIYTGSVTSSATSWQTTQTLPDGTYRAYVAIAQIVNGQEHKSAGSVGTYWEYHEFTVNVALPAAPSIVATADNTNARIALAVSDAAGAASTDALELERSVDGGTTWGTVRQLESGVIGNSPVIVATGTFSDSADGTSHAAALPTPTGGIVADDLLIAVAGMDGNPTFSWPADWTEIKDVAGNGSAVRAGVAWKRAVGGESGTITVTTSASEGGGIRILCVRGAHTTTAPEISTGVSAATANADPDSFNPAGWDVEHTLWIAGMVNDGNVAVTAGPSGYFDFGNTRWANASGAGVATAFKHTTAASENPGAFTQTAEDTHAFTIAVRPVAAYPTLTVYDYEAPNGTTMTYRVRALHNYSGVYAASAWTQDTEAWTSDSWWLKHPNLPALNMAVRIRSFQTVARAGRQGVFQALGASYPVVVADVRESKRGTVVLRLDSVGEQDALDALLDTAGTLLLQSPPDQGGPDYIRVVNHQRDRAIDWADSVPSFDALEFVTVGTTTGTVALFPSDSLFPG